MQVVAAGSQANMVRNYEDQDDMSGAPTESTRGAIVVQSTIQGFKGTKQFFKV